MSATDLVVSGLYSSGQLWKRKYQAMRDELARKERQWREREGILRLGASWLILAADRSDDVLNSQLEDLRVALRTERQGSMLQSLVEAISKSIVRLDKQRNEAVPRPEAIDVMRQLIRSLRVPATVREDQAMLCKRLDEVGQGDDLQPIVRLTADFIRRLIAFEVGNTTEAPPRAIACNGDTPSPLSISVDERAVGLADDHGREAQARHHNHTAEVPERRAIVNDVLVQLIELLELPPELRTQADFLVERLRRGSAAQPIKARVTDVADLAMQARIIVEREKQEMEQFLAKLAVQLEEIDDSIGSSAEAANQARQRRKTLDETLDGHLRGIASTVREASDLDHLKSAIQERLDTIQHYLLDERCEEQARSAQAQEEMEQLTTRIQELDAETRSLRERIQREHEQAMRDPLTGLFNRLAYNERVQQEYARWKRYRRPFSLAVLDVDHFKRINDSHGHSAGDKVLKALGELLAARSRETDFIARYGGEEFVILMSETSGEDALNKVEQLCNVVATCRFHYREKTVPVTISCGVAEVREDDAPDSLFERADQALYRAKQAGRNRSLQA